MLRSVSKKTFYVFIGPLNVHPRIVSDKYPYTTEWRLHTNGRQLIGVSIDKIEQGVRYTDYFLA